MDRNKRIIKNTVVFAIGNFGSKILAYIMVLVYTYYIGKSELGYYDLILTTVNLLHPLLLMAFDEGIYRWLIGDDETDQTVIFSTCIKTTGLTTIASIGILLLVNLFFDFQYVGYIALFIATTMMYSMFLNSIRGLTKNKLYATSGIMNSVIILLIEVIGLVFLSMGIECLLIAKIIGNTVAMIFLYVNAPEFHGFWRIPINRSLAKSIFKYSFPLVPNQISWWIVNGSDRYIILFFLGTDYNGIYTISNKFPTIITTITAIVYLALQETIIKEYNSPDRDEFYSKTFEKYYTLLFSLILCAIPATDLVIRWFVSPAYSDAWRYIGFLYLSTVFSALSSFMGIGYQISKETKRSVVSTISAAGINVLINVIFAPIIGLHAASTSTFIAYFVLFLIRIRHCKRYFTLHINWKLFGLLLGVSLGVIAGSYFLNEIGNIILAVTAFAALLVLNKNFVLGIIKSKKKNAK